MDLAMSDGGKTGSDMNSSQVDMAMPAVDDMANAPPDLLPPAPYYFDPVIQTDISFLNCASGACHGIHPPILIVNPTTMQQYDANYTALMPDFIGGANSLFLTKTLLNSGVSHADNGPPTKPFSSTADATYQRWQTWLLAGALKRP